MSLNDNVLLVEVRAPILSAQATNAVLVCTEREKGKKRGQLLFPIQQQQQDPRLDNV